MRRACNEALLPPIRPRPSLLGSARAVQGWCSAHDEPTRTPARTCTHANHGVCRSLQARTEAHTSTRSSRRRRCCACCCACCFGCCVHCWQGSRTCRVHPDPVPPLERKCCGYLRRRHRPGPRSSRSGPRCRYPRHLPFDERPRLPKLRSTRSRGVLELPPVLQSAAGGCHRAVGPRPSWLAFFCEVSVPSSSNDATKREETNSNRRLLHHLAVATMQRPS